MKLLPFISLVFLFCQSAHVALPQKPEASLETLHRTYVDGATSHYEMRGDNDGWRYTI